MLEDLLAIIDAMSITSEHRDGWKQIEPTIGYGKIVTLSWPKWKLKIVSFKMPEQWSGNTDDAENILTIDNLYLIDGQLVWRTSKSEQKYDWSNNKQAFVIDIVDMFLSGEWTPPWKCGFCQQRHNKKLLPRW